ncbi:MAG: hypothetical protein FJX52_09040 [Alphaproteobacteria bacterium]|nr:hypothetical protein [Alphaproteobacteria bacterium]
MRTIVRIVGWLLVLAAIGLLVLDLLDLYRTGGFEPMAAGQLWYTTHVASLNLMQAVVQRYLHPAIWDPAATWVLTQPACAVLAVPGLLLLWLARPPRARPRQPLFKEY